MKSAHNQSTLKLKNTDTGHQYRIFNKSKTVKLTPVADKDNRDFLDGIPYVKKG